MPKRQPGRPPVLPGFQYLRPLGTGGFADVFLYEQDMPRRQVAVKVLLESVVDFELVRMFNAEADSLARLSSHPSILTIFEATISADGRPFLVMEYCPGSYQSRYREEIIPVPEVLQTSIRIASALETCHRAGVLHRDIKPSNILVNSFGSALLSDFGIATSSSPSGGEVLALSVPWSAPEVVAEETAGTIPSEVYSLGATIYTLLAGRSPYEVPQYGKNTTEDLRKRIKKGGYTPINRPDVPPALEAILERAMAKNPQDRFGSVFELASALQQVQYQLGLPATPIEVSDTGWAVAGPVDFSNNQLRGPVRSTVEVPKRRGVHHTSRPTSAGSWHGDEEKVGGITRGRLVAIVGIAVVATAGIVTGIIAALGGF